VKKEDAKEQVAEESIKIFTASSGGDDESADAVVVKEVFEQVNSDRTDESNAALDQLASGGAVASVDSTLQAASEPVIKEDGTQVVESGDGTTQEISPEGVVTTVPLASENPNASVFNKPPVAASVTKADGTQVTVVENPDGTTSETSADGVVTTVAVATDNPFGDPFSTGPATAVGGGIDFTGGIGGFRRVRYLRH
jgi:hypothetical protein